MQSVSDNWKDAHKRTILNETFVEVSLDIGDPDALAAATAEDNGAIYISDSSKLTSREDEPIKSYCTLEQNMWCLDGRMEAIPESDFGKTGYVSEVLSDDTCIFSSKKPIIRISFGGRVFTSLLPGVTITWSNTYGEYPDTFIVRAYNGDDIVAEKEVTGNRLVKSMVFVDINVYSKIEIIVVKWCLPNHRARVEEIFVGLRKVYGKTDLFDYSHSQVADMYATSLPKSDIKFTISNIDGEYNPLNRSGLAKYLIERQPVKSRYGMKKDDGTVEWIKGGTFYLSEWYAKQNGVTAEFTARDLFEFMSDIYEDTDYYKDLKYDNTTGVITSTRTLYKLADDVLKSAPLPKGVEWVIDDELEKINTSAPLPEDTRANCLQLIANAGRCAMYQDRDGKLHIERIKLDVDEDESKYEINSFNSYAKPEIEISKPVKYAMTKYYTYSFVDGKIESTASQYMTIWGSMYDESKKDEVITIDNPLITDTDTADFVGRGIMSMLSSRMTLDYSWRADVRLDALDEIKDGYISNRVFMTEVEYKYNGAFRATGKGKVYDA